MEVKQMQPMKMNEVPEVARDWFMSKVVPVPESGCWIWEGSETKGYGSVYVNGRGYRAHRVSYRIHKGIIPRGLVIDHLCRVKCCVNPDHLEPVSNRENGLRGIGFVAVNHKKRYCVRGHELRLDDAMPIKRGLVRVCLKCQRIRDRARRQRERDDLIGGVGTKLTAEHVTVIKRLLADGALTNRIIGSMFNVTPKAIRDIKIGRCWKNVPAQTLSSRKGGNGE